MSSSKKSRRKGTGWRATKQPLHERRTRDQLQFNPPHTPVPSVAARKAGRSGAARRLAEQRGVEPGRERGERLAAETDIERATVPNMPAKAPHYAAISGSAVSEICKRRAVSLAVIALLIGMGIRVWVAQA
jgi:hypothetical protein